MNGRELVRRLWESFEAREWDAARRVFTEDVVNYAEGWAFETEDGPIARVREYWVDPPREDLPAWRARWLQPLEPV